MGYYSENYNQTVKEVLGELDKALGAVNPETAEKFVKAVLEADQVYFVGVGRDLHILELRPTMLEKLPNRLLQTKIFW